MNLLFFKEFIGPFNGFYRNKETGVLIVWGNQTGDSAPFYYVGVDGNVVVSNKFNLVYEELSGMEWYIRFRIKPLTNCFLSVIW